LSSKAEKGLIALSPLGYIGEPQINSNLYTWALLLNDGATKAGRPRASTQHYKQWLEEIGFEDVLEKRFFWPTSPWAKGKYESQSARSFSKTLATV
jgi:hypothetical protein